jgi:hypothetical protein
MLGEKLLIKMWETLAKGGVESLASPWQIKREGRAHTEVRRDELLFLAQAEVDVNQIKEGKKKLLADGSLISISDQEMVSEGYFGRIEPIISFEDVSFKVAQQNKSEEIQQEINLNRTIALAEDELLRSQQEAPEESVEPDWIYRWRDHAKNTQNDELRKIWARTLAGEVKAPGSYSLRTLEFIKNLSQDEAISISKLGQFVITNSIFKCERLKEAGVDFNFLLQMDDLGILSGVQGGQTSGLELTLSSFGHEKYINNLVNRNIILLIENEDPKKTVKLGYYQISRVGVELLSLGDFSADDQYMRQVGEQAKSQGFDVKIALWVPTSPTQGQYYNAQTI